MGSPPNQKVVKEIWVCQNRGIPTMGSFFLVSPLTNLTEIGTLKKHNTQIRPTGELYFFHRQKTGRRKIAQAPLTTAKQPPDLVWYDCTLRVATVWGVHKMALDLRPLEESVGALHWRGRGSALEG